MKKVLSILVMAIIAVQMAVAGDVVTMDEKQLPVQAREFIKKHFAAEKISYIKIEDEFLRKKEYEVVLTNGVEINFDHNGNWEEVDCKRNAIPENIMLPNIREYIKTHFGNNIVTQIDRDSRGYELELDNDLSVKFNKTGNFLRLDD